MSSESELLPPAEAGSDPGQVRRVALSGFLGNTIEFYDFLLYGTASAIVFNKLFFSNLTPTLGTIAAFATLAAGYVARPLGGIIFGHFGDRIGRKSILLVTMTVMGVTSGLIGVLPTYATIGATAPVLLLLLRVIQGLAIGGEWGGAGLMAAEHAAPARRGLVTAFPQMGLPAGSILASGVVAILTLLPRDVLLGWAWRIPFLLSFLLLAVGLFVRMRITESPVYVRATTAAAPPSVPLVSLLRRYPLNIVRGVLAAIGSVGIQGIFGPFLISYAVGIGYAQPTVLAAQIAGAVVGMVTVLLWGILSDRIGRRPVFLIGAVMAVVMAYPSFIMINTGSVALLYVAEIIMFGIAITAMNGPMVALLSELFATDVRYTGVSFCYQVGTAVGGGFAPLIAAVLVASAGGGKESASVSLFLLATAVLAGLAVFSIQERRGADLANEPGSGPVRAPLAGTGEKTPEPA